MNKKLQRLLAGLEVGELESLRKDKQLNLRVSEAELESLRTVSASLGLTVSEYLLALHRAILGKLAGK